MNTQPTSTMTTLDLSTGHVSRETHDILDRHPSRWPLAGWQGQYGWIIYAHDERPDDVPDDLWQCLDYARQRGFDYVRFDADFDQIEGLPYYDHA